ncbi:MAG TPA: M20/M25/M40 family metallo-hydrolase [Pyrinomonadaceae bacterium]|nr:M20/M25/M40 family metallo-hydrolase [Pyrinomonadaceae bacterium]
MRLQRLGIALSVSLLLVISSLPVDAQVRRAAPQPIRERDIRAELGFLASDAMQGRGSGTNNERLAAEYIGSQFRQFGLEPAGDADAGGNKDFVQRVVLESTRFSTAPSLTATAGANSKTWKFGQDFLLSFLRAPKITGDLQVIGMSGSPAKGAVVVLTEIDGADVQKRQEAIMKARSAGAAAVAVAETENNRRTREAGNVRLPSLPGRIAGDAVEASFAVINLRAEAVLALAAMGDGAKVELSGPTEAAVTRTTWNAVGMLRGSDPKAASEVIMLSAHLDHLGVNESLTGDKIFNGADDDASGCIAVLELARVFASGKRPRRTIYFVCFGSEESGGFGARYFISNSPVPLPQIVADIQFEMIGRPDPKVPAGTLWLTGYDRSTLGPTLAKQGAALVADPHPQQNFFQRSDNYTLALRGVVAHTISSFGLHTDYHRPSDDISKIDFPFMTRSLNSLVRPIRWLANSNFRPSWLPGQAPTR